MPIASHSNRQLNLPDDFLLLEPGQELREPARLMPSALAASQAQQQNPYPLAYYLNRWVKKKKQVSMMTYNSVKYNYLSIILFDCSSHDVTIISIQTTSTGSKRAANWLFVGRKQNTRKYEK